MKAGSVLIVYEHRLFAQGLRQMLLQHGLKMTQVRANSPRAEECVRKVQPDVLIAECDELQSESSPCLDAMRSAAPGALVVQLTLNNNIIAIDGQRSITATCGEDLITIVRRRLESDRTGMMGKE